MTHKQSKTTMIKKWEYQVANEKMASWLAKSMSYRFNILRGTIRLTNGRFIQECISKMWRIAGISKRIMPKTISSRAYYKGRFNDYLGRE